MQKPKFVENQIYHVYNRGVEKRSIFLENNDYLRFIHDLFEFNDVSPALESNIRFSHRNPSSVNSLRLEQCLEIGSPNKPNKRKFLVEILIFVLMPNHYHLLLRQKKENGIIKFMQKLGVGYSMYFNQKYERVGPLFQGRFKAVLVNNESHFIHLPYYIHTNPLDLKFPEWKSKSLKNYKEAIKFLENYRWSSFPDYIGKKNFPSVSQREFLLEFFGGPEQYKKDTIEWLKEMDLEKIKDIILE
ncbi:transposase [Patescibacteria group bacterium]|nr:transposase [Patescibacteria group bacterium]